MSRDLEKIPNRGEPIYCEESFRVYYGHKNIFLGSNIYLIDALINAGDSEGRVIIEDNVFFGHGVKILARGHDYRKFGVERQQTITEKPITIKEGAWIGSGAIILGGVEIGKNAVVGAGSVVTKSIPDYTVAVGNPAKVIKFINEKEGKRGRVKRFFNSIFKKIL
jgi:acetyltransferase-like isoleucine patch superfamily enzyme